MDIPLLTQGNLNYPLKNDVDRLLGVTNFCSHLVETIKYQVSTDLDNEILPGG